MNHPATNTRTRKAQKPEESEHDNKGGLSLDDRETQLANKDGKEAEDKGDEADGEGETGKNVKIQVKIEPIMKT